MRLYYGAHPEQGSGMPGAPPTLQLHYTPRSHFSRKVRILLDALQLPVELFDAGNVAESDPAHFGPNPLFKVPTLVDGAHVVFDSDHIAAHIVRRHDPADRFAVLTAEPEALNARAVMNGVMAAEVEIILAERTGIDTRGLQRFEKLRESIRGGLAWLDARCDRVPQDPSYLAFHFVAMWDHLAFYKTIDVRFDRLQAYAQRWAGLPYVARSRPI